MTEFGSMVTSLDLPCTSRELHGRPGYEFLLCTYVCKDNYSYGQITEIFERLHGSFHKKIHCCTDSHTVRRDTSSRTSNLFDYKSNIGQEFFHPLQGAQCPAERYNLFKASQGSSRLSLRSSKTTHTIRRDIRLDTIFNSSIVYQSRTEDQPTV